MRLHPACGRRCWLAIALGCALPLTLDAATLTVRADDWFPVNGKPRSAQEGVYIDVLRAVLEPAGHTLDYQLQPWDAAVADVRAGRQDCVVGAARTDAPDLVFARRPWMTFDNVYYAMADRGIRIESLDDLQRYTLGVIQDYSYGDALDAYIEAHRHDPQRIRVVDMGRDPLAIQVSRLVAGRIQVTVEASVVMQAHLREARLHERIVPVGALHEEQHIFLACSPAKPELKPLLQLIDDGYDRLESAGTLAAFYAKYGLSVQELLRAESR